MSPATIRTARTANLSTVSTPSTHERSTSPKHCSCSAAPTNGRPPQNPLDLSLIAEEATETLFPLQNSAASSSRPSGDIAPIIGSHALLLQLTTNLVQNAIVHNLPEHGTVWVSTSVQPKSGDHAGVGLGLAIVKSITQAHDGTLTLTPRDEGGLRVTVRLPAAPPHNDR